MDGATSSRGQQNDGGAAPEAETGQGYGVIIVSGGVDDLMTQFPSAAQPEMMRAAEKDDHYVGQLCEACYDAFRSAFGTRLAVAYQNELKLAGRVLYYLLTTGSGLQTLGEEYCDIVQVAGPSGLPASPARRTILVFYQTVLPYLTERLSARAAARGNLLASEIEEDTRHREEESIVSEESVSARPHGMDLTRNTNGASTSRQPSLTRRLHRAWMTALQRWPVVLPSVQGVMMLIMRTHLMVYYFEGLYYHIGKRAAGIRYSYMGKLSQPRPRYHILGLFLLVQLSFVYGDWMLGIMMRLLSACMQSGVAQHHVQPAGNQGIAILDEDGHNIHDKASVRPSSSWTDSEASGSSKCPLCLSPRQHPTATPCGHVFCWNCVAEWCNEKPECPLCRSPVTHPDLVCVYHADF